MKALATDMSPFCILDEYCRNSKGGYMAEAEKIVIAGPEELYRHVPVCSYLALATVDKDEVESFHTIHLLLEDYVSRRRSAGDGENVRPLSVAVFGPPGSGKSFGVKQIASSIGHFSLTSLNLSQYDDPTELFEGLDEALSCGDDEIPLVFMDEFDSELHGVSGGWLTMTVKNRFFPGDRVEVLTPDGVRTLTVREIRDAETGEILPAASPAGRRVSVPCGFSAGAGDFVRGVNRNHL
jgi:hypothetical protein